MRMRRLLTGIAGALALYGCIWDSDTLEFEMRQVPGAAETLTGRLEQNPPLYYRMRRDRVAKELERHPGKLELYDDLAVAHERLGDQDKAIEVMGAKRKVLESLPSKASAKEHWYRFHANIGTFYAHRALAKKTGLGDLRIGRDHIAKALEINPEAHFGRERVQLQVMNWAIDVLEGKDEPLAERFEFGDEKAVRGLLGLMALGSAWESIDVIGAVMELTSHDHAAISRMAYLRIQELQAKGAKSLQPTAEFKEQDSLTKETEPATLEGFRILRKSADEFRSFRENFMMERLSQGRHPDTDKTFWDGYQPPPTPDVPDPSLFTRAVTGNWLQLKILVGVSVFVVATYLLLRYSLFKLRSRHRWF